MPCEHETWRGDLSLREGDLFGLYAMLRGHMVFEPANQRVTGRLHGHTVEISPRAGSGGRGIGHFAGVRGRGANNCLLRS